MNEKLKAVLFNLISGIEEASNKHGVPEKVYTATCVLIELVLGKGARDHFERLINAVDGSFYFDDPEAAKEWLAKWMPESKDAKVIWSSPDPSKGA